MFREWFCVSQDPKVFGEWLVHHYGEFFHPIKVGQPIGRKNCRRAILLLLKTKGQN
jgi:hypothetical protein